MKTYIFFLFVLLNTTALLAEKGNLLNKYPLVIEKLVFYKNENFKAFYGGPIDRKGKGIQWLMPVSFDNKDHQTRAVYEIAFINCTPDTAENAEILFVDVSDVNIKFKNRLVPDYQLFSYLLKGKYYDDKYIVVRSVEVANIYYPDVFIAGLGGYIQNDDKSIIVNYLNTFFKTQNFYREYYQTSKTNDEVVLETEEQVVFKPLQVSIQVKDNFFPFKITKVIKKQDVWKLYYLVYSASVSLDELENSQEPLLVRMDSGCISGQIYDDEACDCLDQLHDGLQEIISNTESKGLIIHIPSHDGRGFGTAPKAETEIYKRGGSGRIHTTPSLNTVAAAKLLYGCDEYDFRTFDGAAEILFSFKINNVLLLTDNKDKVATLEKHGIKVTRKKTETNKPSCLEHIQAKKNSSLYFHE